MQRLRSTGLSFLRTGSRPWLERGERAHIVEEDTVGRDEVVLNLGQVERELQDSIAVSPLARVHRPPPCSTMAYMCHP